MDFAYLASHVIPSVKEITKENAYASMAILILVIIVQNVGRVSFGQKMKKNASQFAGRTNFQKGRNVNVGKDMDYSRIGVRSVQKVIF